MLSRGLITQPAIAWVAPRPGNGIVPLVGARRREGLSESLGTCDAGLTTVDLSRVEAAVRSDATAGQRYASHAMRTWVADAMPYGVHCFVKCALFLVFLLSGLSNGNGCRPSGDTA